MPSVGSSPDWSHGPWLVSPGPLESPQQLTTFHARRAFVTQLAFCGIQPRLVPRALVGQSRPTREFPANPDSRLLGFPDTRPRPHRGPAGGPPRTQRGRTGDTQVNLDLAEQTGCPLDVPPLKYRVSRRKSQSGLRAYQNPVIFVFPDLDLCFFFGPSVPGECTFLPAFTV